MSGYGAFWIPKYLNFDDLKIEIIPKLENNFILRKEIIRIFTFENILAVAVGEEGVDIYRFGHKLDNNFDKEIYYLNTISNT